MDYLNALNKFLLIDRILTRLGAEPRHTLVEHAPQLTAGLFDERSHYICDWSLDGTDGHWDCNLIIGLRDVNEIEFMYDGPSGVWTISREAFPSTLEEIKRTRHLDQPSLMAMKAVLAACPSMDVPEDVALRALEEAATKLLAIFRPTS